jgi:uncharacterized protein (TIGR03067 family)
MMKRIAALSLSLVLVPAAVLSASQAAKPLSKTMEAVQGVWMMTNTNGQDLAGSGQEIVITITGDKYVQTVNGTVVEKGSFKIDDAKKPMILDIMISEGDNAGKAQVGIMTLTGKTMTGKLSEPGATTRPTDFTPALGCAERHAFEQ